MRKYCIQKIIQIILLEVLVPLIDELNIPVIIKTELSDGSFTYEHLNLDISRMIKNSERI